jgi:hypothetical protein
MLFSIFFPCSVSRATLFAPRSGSTFTILHQGSKLESKMTKKIQYLTIKSSIPETVLCEFEPPGSGYFHKQAKKLRKTLISAVTSYNLLPLRLKCYKESNKPKIYFCYHLESH